MRLWITSFLYALVGWCVVIGLSVVFGWLFGRENALAWIFVLFCLGMPTLVIWMLRNE